MERMTTSQTDPLLYPSLYERHLSYLAERAVSETTAKAARLTSLGRYQIEHLLYRDLPPKGGGLGIPYLGHGEDTWRVRLDDPQDKKARWRTAKGEGVRPYLPPSSLVSPERWKDISEPVCLLEGPVKALASLQAGFLSIGLGGVETGHDAPLWREKKIARLHPELLARVSWTGRTVIIAFDANRLTNPAVALGEARLGMALKAAGARVKVAATPRLPGDKEGPDDLIAQQGPGAYRALLEAALPADPMERLAQIEALPKGREAALASFELLESMPFLAALYLGGSSLVARVAYELRRYLNKKEVAEKVATFRGALTAQEAAEGGDTFFTEAHIEALNRLHAIVFAGGTGSILWEDPDPELSQRTAVRLMKMADFRLKYLSRPGFVQEGKTVMRTTLGDFWLRHPKRRQFQQIVFSPEQETEDNYNLWKGWAVTPVPGDWSLMQAHIKENLCQGNEELYRYVLLWMADAVQHPGQRPGVALVLRGKEGTGKSIFAKEFGAIYGAHFLHVSNSRHLLGNFNAHLANCALLFGDEAFWAGDKASEGALKALITEPTLNLERKGQDVIQVPNLIRLILASNNDWVVPAGLEARRFCVLDVSEDKMQDTEYFLAILAQMEKGGRGAMMHDLMQIPVSADQLRKIPHTPGLLEQKLLSLSPIQRFWYGRLFEGHIVPYRAWGDWIPSAEIHRAYIDEATQSGDRKRLASIDFGMHLRKLCPKGVLYRRSTTELRDKMGSTIQPASDRPNCYQFPSLELCREFFADTLKAPIQWPKDERTSQDAFSRGTSNDDPDNLF